MRKWLAHKLERWAKRTGRNFLWWHRLPYMLGPLWSYKNEEGKKGDLIFISFHLYFFSIAYYRYPPNLIWTNPWIVNRGRWIQFAWKVEPDPIPGSKFWLRLKYWGDYL